MRRIDVTSVIRRGLSDVGTAKEVYEKMLKCISEMRTAPPNAWSWSLVAKCGTQEDMKLLFDILERLRRFLQYKDSGAPGAKEYVHISLHQRNGKKSLTTVLGLKKDMIYYIC